MKKTKVVATKNLQMRCPLIPSIVFYLFFEHINASEWIWGAIGLIFLFVWVGWFYALITQKQIDIFKKEEDLKWTKKEVSK